MATPATLPPPSMLDEKLKKSSPGKAGMLAFGLILAGGLRADNVAAAIATVRPFGIDVSSGVEERPGRKDPGLVAAFVAAARAAQARGPELTEIRQ